MVFQLYIYLFVHDGIITIAVEFDILRSPSKLPHNAKSVHTLQPAQVQTTGKSITRDALARNEKVLGIAINYLGSRVSVPAVFVHVQSFYDFITVPCSSGVAYKYI